MTPDAAGIEAALAAGLAAHEYAIGPVLGGAPMICRCGAVRKPDADESLQDLHRAHQAAALLPVVTQAQAAERERIAQAIEAIDAEGPSNYRSPYAIRTEAARIARADESGA